MAKNFHGRMKKGFDPVITEYLVGPEIKDDVEHKFQVFVDVNKAHVLMLAKQGIIKEDVAKKILEVADEMGRMGDKPSFNIDLTAEDIYVNLERYLVEKTSLDIGGQQHTARSRNDLYAATTRMALRRPYLRICEDFLELRQTLIELAAKNADAVFSGYTHLQPSEPTTFGHYLSGVLAAMERDFKRVAAVYETINTSPMGAGSMGSTTWPIDRQMVCDFLGFDKIMDNSIDCVASRDFATEFLAALSIAAVTISRFCFDLHVWSTPDFGYVEVDDSCAGCSSIMPQKKNPFTLEHVKAKAAHIEGFLVSALNCQKNTPFTNCQDVGTESVAYLWKAVEEMECMLKVLKVTAAGITLHREKMISTAQSNFCTVTELANYLVRKDGISFRMAHELVAMVVDYMITHQLRANEITAAILNELYVKMFNRTTTMTDEDIQAALDPVANLKLRKLPGGPSPEEVLRQLKARQSVLDLDRELTGKRSEMLDAAKTKLEEAVADFIR